MDLLVSRFGRPELIRYTHIQALLHLQPPPKCQGSRYVKQLWGFRDEILNHVRSLETLGVEGEKSEAILTPIIVSRLPDQIRMEWARDGAGHEGDLAYLLEFLEQEIGRLERSDMFKDKEADDKHETRKPFNQGKRKDSKVSSAGALSTATTVSSNCVFCSKGHSSSSCSEMLKLNIEDRKEKIKNTEVCYRFLLKGHHAKGCSLLCLHCNGFHHLIICYKYNNPSQSSNSHKASSTSNSGKKVKKGSSTTDDKDNVLMSNLSSFRVTDPKGTVLGTASIDIRCPDGSTRIARVLFNNGADRSYISSKCVKSVKPNFITKADVPYSSFGGHQSGPKSELYFYCIKLMG